MTSPILRRLVIAAGVPRRAITFRTQLLQDLPIDAVVARFEDVPHLLTPATDGDLFLLALDPADVTAIEIIIREARVQQLPVRFTLVESEQVRSLRLLVLLGEFKCRWLWPQQNRELVAWTRQAIHAGTPFIDPATESTGERFQRLLLNEVPSLTPMVEKLCIAASHDVGVLIEGEPGTGKSFLARLIHDFSARSSHRFAMVSCGALSGPVLARELFGHAGGEGPNKDMAQTGKLVAIGEGTVLLDEIDTLTPDNQARLLRTLETGEIEPIGSADPEPCRARIIAATNWNLADAVERGTFRRDLYYRLNVINLQIPPLRHRPEDIGPLVRKTMARYGTKFGKRLVGICPEALRALETFPWPGNLRQLENVVQQAVLVSNGSELRLHHLSPAIVPHSDAISGELRILGHFGGTLRQGRETSERANILRALEKAGQSRTRAAKLLGVSRVTLYKKMKKYGLFSARAVQASPVQDDDSLSG